MNTDFAREQMIKQQVRAWDVLDEDVLRILSEVPREDFVSPEFAALAFADVEIPLPNGQSMMTPTVEGRVLQALGLKGTERVLEIGTGSGFLTACLAKLSAHVTSIDIYDDFLKSAADRLEQQGTDNVELLAMDATESLPDGTFDAIAVTGSIQKFDPRLVGALAPNGRLFVIVGNPPAMEAKLVVRTNDKDWQSETQFETNVAPLINGFLPPQFSF